MKRLFTFFATTLLLASCSGYYADENLPPTEQELQAAKQINPKGALQSGVFHMQSVQEGSSVLVENSIQLKKPDLPPFDVAYISRDLESIVLELSNAAGESVVIPQGLRGRTVTLIHSGADFRQMLELVLSKAGYFYNYVDGVWYITRYPIKNYILELGQSSRKGSIIADTEVSGIESTTSSSGEALDTSYSDEVWDQVEETITELINVDATDLQANQSSAGGVTGGGKIVANNVEDTSDLLAPPDIEGAETVNDILGTLTESGNVRPLSVDAPESTDHLVEEEASEPWFRLTKSVGMITVRAAPEAHRLIEDYLEQVQRSAHRQILVEVRIVAIIEDRTTDRGANISREQGLFEQIATTFGFAAADPVTVSGLQGGFFTATTSSVAGDINVVVQALSSIGDVYTVSSPTVLARNNQISRVSVTRQIGYAETSVEQNTTSAGTVVIGSRVDTAKFANAGTVLSVLPYIGKSKVQMRMRLSVASQVGTTDVRTAIGGNDPITNQVPELSTNVIDQDMIIEFGRVYAIGGLIETSTNFDHSYLPGISKIPGIGEILQRAKTRKQDTEFMVLMKISRS